VKKFESIVEKTSQVLNTIAGYGIVVTMVLIVLNVILRSLFNIPIKGVYEISGYLTAIVVAFTLAQCALEGAHIAVEILMDKLDSKIQLVINTIWSSIMIVFLFFIGIQVFSNGITVMKSGEVSPTAQIPFYPFIFLVSIGFFVLCFAEIHKTVKGVRVK
jgi:TRAP-type C4-dicarboxylate transport system permease small subunit